MTAHGQLILLIPIAYFIGSIPFGLIVGLSRGVDPRKSGSGNIGATNLGRLLGGRFFALVFVLDLLKGLLPMLIAAVIVRGVPRDRILFLLWLLVGFGAIAGHMFSIFLRFRGGKGVATSTGVILGMFPYFTIPALIAVAVWIVIFIPWRYVSLASIIGSISFPIAYLAMGMGMKWDIGGAQLPLAIFSVVMAGLIVFKHRTNIARLRAGTESKFVSKSKPLAEAPIQQP